MGESYAHLVSTKITHHTNGVQKHWTSLLTGAIVKLLSTLSYINAEKSANDVRSIFDFLRSTLCYASNNNNYYYYYYYK